MKKHKFHDDYLHVKLLDFFFCTPIGYVITVMSVAIGYAVIIYYFGDAILAVLF